MAGSPGIVLKFAKVLALQDGMGLAAEFGYRE
jgi:hypothetical protein